MPRVGLDPDIVAREALRIVDESGVDALSLASLADRLGVKRPSLYNHIRDMEGLRASMKAIVFDEITAAVEEVRPRKGREGLFAVTRALRGYVLRHPRRIDLLVESAEEAPAPLRAASERLLRGVLELLGSYGLTGASAVHGARLLRALWIGFALIEQRGGYAMDVPVEDSFTFALEAMHHALSRVTRRASR